MVPPPSYSTSGFPRYQLANIPLSLAIFFGLWACWETSTGKADAQLPLAPIMVPLRYVGLFFFRAEWMIRFVFWCAVAAHLFEASIAAKFAWKVSGGGQQQVDRLPFVLFWTIQSGAVGYPSLKLIKEQRRLQRKKDKAADGGAAAGAGKAQ